MKNTTAIRIPAKYQPLLETVEKERGYWAYTMPGYRFASTCAHVASHTSQAGILSDIRSIEPCPCEECEAFRNPKPEPMPQALADAIAHRDHMQARLDDVPEGDKSETAEKRRAFYRTIIARENARIAELSPQPQPEPMNLDRARDIVAKAKATIAQRPLTVFEVGQLREASRFISAALHCQE